MSIAVAACAQLPELDDDWTLLRDALVVPTTWVDPGEEWQPPAADFVVKPAVSSGGFETARYRIDDVSGARQHVARLHDRGATVMVQPYQGAVDERGETALIYLGGQFSHAVRKGPLLQLGAGVVDQLWQRQQITAAEPTNLELDVAEGALAAAHRIAGPVTYARVDLAGADAAVLELELIEPSLFLDTSPGSPELFAKSIRQLVR